MKHTTHFLHRSVRRRGFTLVELMVSSVVVSMVFVIIGSLQSISGHGIKDVYSITRARSARMMAIDRLRYTLANGRIGTAVTSMPAATGGSHRIQYVDPTKGNVTSQFTWDTDLQALTYDDNINASPGPRTIVRGPIDVNFTLLGAGELVQLQVRSMSEIGLGKQETQDGMTTVYLRN